MFPDSFFYLLSILMALCLIALNVLFNEIKKLKSDIHVLNNITKRFDIYHQIKFDKFEKEERA